jgi:UDP-N-acetylglucosamine 2-epimerase (hydrolysing)
MKNIGFLTGTRADYGKLKPLMKMVSDSEDFNLIIYTTGIHLIAEFGMTVNEILKDGLGRVITFSNQNYHDSMETALANTIMGFSKVIEESKIDLLIVHGDRVEALGGAIVCSFKNILVGHIEGGEVSGTIDGSIRHAITKFSHIHFVANKDAYNRIIQLGENTKSIFEIGSPDVDALLSENLPELHLVKSHYGISFENYAIFIFHPVTTEIDNLKLHIEVICKALEESGKKFILIKSNNDTGSEIIDVKLKELETLENFAYFPSIKFESFITLLKNSEFIIGNSSVGVREAQYFNLPSINIGTRQKNRSNSRNILHVNADKKTILEAIEWADNYAQNLSGLIDTTEFGNGQSANLFMQYLRRNEFWDIPIDKTFQDLN